MCISFQEASEDNGEQSSWTRNTQGAASARVPTSSLKKGLPAMLVGQKSQENEPDLMPLEDVEPEDALAQFSYAPATQTTVVTTTKTVTTKLPPIILKAPPRLCELDPKHYPLAMSPTPQYLRTIDLNVDGRPTRFHEADDTLGTLQQLKQQHKALNESQGSLRTTVRSPPEIVTPTPDQPQTRSSSTHKSRSNASITADRRRKRAVSPGSFPIPLAGTEVPRQKSRKRRMVSTGRPSPNLDHPEPPARKPPTSRLHLVQTSTPVTPPVNQGNLRIQSLSARPSPRMHDYEFEDATSFKTSSTYDTFDNHEDEPQILSPRSEITRRRSSRGLHVANEGSFEDSQTQQSWLGEPAVTPRAESDIDESPRGFLRPLPRPRPSVLDTLDTAAAQDASLPSPSLSPVTAAANIQSRRGYFEHHNPEILHQSPERNDVYENSQPLNASSQDSTATKGFGESIQTLQDPDEIDLAVRNNDKPASARSLMSLPSMVDTFEAVPEEMKNYLIYQFLRRCSKPVLHFIADVVNPALKCDFLRLLPVELCLNIIGNLDVKALCRAAQVSKRWRRLIDSSETIWKRRFDADHYVLPDGELERAIHEGWAWQFASHPSDFERDVFKSTSEADASLTSLMSLDRPLKRSKRKAKSKSKSVNGKQPQTSREVIQNALNVEKDEVIDIASADGPYAAAHLAAAQRPKPSIGLPRLENVHLFKSIYMRHHLIRKSWMTDDVSPRHIAFRAHQRHVVTCLQFDAEKILTGSDDANINVYDTKTGALRARLEGHDGGVWALQYKDNVLVSGSTDRTVRVWDIAKGRCTQIFQGHTSTVRCLQILMPTPVGKTHDGRQILLPKQPLIITGSRDSNLRVWRLPKPEDPDLFQTGPAPDEATESPYYVRTLAGHHHSVRAIAAHADTLVSGSYDCSVRVWKISTGETIHRLNGHNQKVYSVVLDTKRNRCISGSMDNLVKVWSLETGSVLFNLEGHSSLVGLLDLQQDRLVSAAADSTLRIWDPENGHCRSTLTAHTGAITCFQHDGQKVISGSDRTLKMWNVANGEFAKDLLTDLSGVWQVKFDERRCVAAVQRNNLTYIEVLDFGASRDGFPKHKRGKRIVVNADGKEVSDPHTSPAEIEIVGED
ncbi:SCF ubiquitin ligase complex subunit cdc4 [Lecanora helva]